MWPTVAEDWSLAPGDDDIERASAHSARADGRAGALRTSAEQPHLGEDGIDRREPLRLG